MEKEKKIFINTLSRIIERAVFLTVGFFLTPYLLGILGQAALGIYVLAEQFLRYCVLLHNATNQGITRFATVHHANGDYKEMNRIFGLGLTIILLLSIPAAILIIVASMFPMQFFGMSSDLAPVATKVIIICGFGAISSMILSMWYTSLFIKEKLYVIDVASLSSRILSVIIVVIIFHRYEPSIITWVSLVVFIGFFFNIIYTLPVSINCLPEMKIRPIIKGLKNNRALITFSGMTLFTYLGNLLFYSTDSIIISNMSELGPEKIIVYNIAQRWDPNIRQFLFGFTFAMAPMITNLVASSDITTLTRPFFRGLRYCMILGLFPVCIFFVYADEFITLWISKTISQESAPVLRILMLNLACCLPMMMSYRFFMALAKLKGVTIMTITGGILNIFLSIMLVKIYNLGVWGVGLSTFITLGLANLIFVPIFVSSYLNISSKDLFVHGLMRSIITILGVAAFAYTIKDQWLPTSWIIMLFQIALCGIVYMIVTYFITFVDEDREKIKQYSKQVCNHIRKAVSI